MKFLHYFYDGTDMSALNDEIIHPRQALALPGADELLTQLAGADVGSISFTQLSADIAQTAMHLCRTGILRKENDHLFFDCPVIFHQDHPVLLQLTARHARYAVDLLLKHCNELYAIGAQKQDAFPPERHLYHLLCGGVLDGTIFDHLEQHQLVSTGKPLSTGADCLTIVYEDHSVLNGFSDGLLCSFNRLRTEQCTFVSFGDSKGYRRDLYRWFMCRSLLKPELADTPLDAMLATATLESLRAEAGKQWQAYMQGTPIPAPWLDVFSHFGYLSGSSPTIPVYTHSEIDTCLSSLDELVIPLLLPILDEALRDIAASNNLTAIKHGVKPADMANEVYHILFGQINEQLVCSGIVTTPPEVPGEGRYLRCIEMNT